MTNQEAVAFARKELEAAYERAEKVGHSGKTRYIKVLEMAVEVLEQKSNTWSLDDAREDFMHDVYNTLDFIPTNEEANRIIDSFDRVTSGIKQEPKWIFVSDRVPDKNGKYLVTRYNSLIGSSICILCYAENLYDIDSFDFNKKRGKSGWYDYDSEWGHVEFDDVIRWMPLPEPVEPKESERV